MKIFPSHNFVGGRKNDITVSENHRNENIELLLRKYSIELALNLKELHWEKQQSVSQKNHDPTQNHELVPSLNGFAEQLYNKTVDSNLRSI